MFDIVSSMAVALGALLSLVTICGIFFELSAPARARRNFVRSAEDLEKCPATLRPSYVKMHRDASAHQVAVIFSRAAFGNGEKAKVAAGLALLVGVSLFAFTLALDPSNYELWPTVLFLGSTAAYFLELAIEAVANRRSLYALIYDAVIVGRDPGGEVFAAATGPRDRNAARGAGVLAFAVVILVAFIVSSGAVDVWGPRDRRGGIGWSVFGIVAIISTGVAAFSFVGLF